MYAFEKSSVDPVYVVVRTRSSRPAAQCIRSIGGKQTPIITASYSGGTPGRP